MAQDFEQVKSRLDNIKAIEPLLGALRTMSMGTWQVALNKLDDIANYEHFLDNILGQLLPHLNKKRQIKHRKIAPEPGIADTIVLIIGTERGLCGKYNQNLVNSTFEWLSKQNFHFYKIWALGSRMIRELSRREIQLSWQDSLQTNTLSSFEKSYTTTRNWLMAYESYAFNQLYITYHQAVKGGKYQFITQKLFPYEIQNLDHTSQQANQLWPPAIIETDPQLMYLQIIHYLLALSYYKTLLQSAVAEHSSRYNLMQEAKNNADEIIEELNGLVNTERKRQITQEMQELASGAGLLDNKLL